LKVWFPLRKGLLRELVGAKPLWVRAVDGVDFDIRRGEVFCLVGESGCGKTSTGKAILKLVEATEGDILLEMPEQEARAYEDARRRPDAPEARRILEALRRKYSVTWKESLPWTPRHLLVNAGAFLAASFLALFGPSIVFGVLTVPFADAWSTIALCVAMGLILGAVGSLPPTRLWRRTRVVLALLTIATIIFVSIPASYFHHVVSGDRSPFDLGGALAAPWQEGLMAMIVGIVFGAIAAGGVSGILVDWRQRTEGLTGIKMRSLRKRLQLIFQDPYESLNPKQSVYEIVSEPLDVNRVVTNPGETAALVRGALVDVGLRPPEEFLLRFPHELSGGQRQRVSIAAALVLQPDFIVADEPVSMLDVSVRTDILQLMMDLRKKRGITYLFITHDLSLAWVLADRIAVMYLGRIVETGTTEQVIAHPIHPYTQALISVVPSPDPRHKTVRTVLKGERPDPVEIPTGCRFHPRCPLAFEKCGWNAEEVAEEIREFQKGIAERLRASISGRLSQAEDLRKRAGESPTEARRLGGEVATADAEAQQLRHGLQRAEAIAASTLVRDPRTVFVGTPTGMAVSELAQSFRDLIAAQRDGRRAFYGVAGVSEDASGVLLTLHASSEPSLTEVAPDNLVACYLASPGAPPHASAAQTMAGP
jgi:oligopeptide/dipeptide ABC transporter ATP-binding protein